MLVAFLLAFHNNDVDDPIINKKNHSNGGVHDDDGDHDEENIVIAEA